ncbi:voltage-dependent T-type calcium channel subunit alpha-1I-like [Brachyhypopomus gauderio]|uniref:voltage-dependent T-type calcium channel subunit alpha-1I-like n=1 Tax=Brachyhypopomus gauderio TaxID=698409 RepID=UPI004041D078
MLLIDNLSGSVFLHYSSPPLCKDCRRHPPEEIHMAELEQVSLRSEQLSDKSSSQALPDDLSLDEQSMYHLVVKETKEEESHGELEEAPEQRPSRGHSTGSEERAPGPEDGPWRSPRARSLSRHSTGGAPCSDSGGGDGGSGQGAGNPRALYPLPAEFFHPTTAALPAPPRPRLGHKARGLRLTSPASWASLRSPGVNSQLLTAQYASHSDSSLATGSSEGSLQTTMEEGLSFSVSPPQDPVFPLEQLETLSSSNSPSTQTLKPVPSVALSLRATRGHQRRQSSCGDGSSPRATRQGSIESSDQEAVLRSCRAGQACNSEQLSETLSSLSLTSLLLPSTLVPPVVKKCNSTGSLEHGVGPACGKDGKQLFATEPLGYLTPPWVEGRGGAKEEHLEASGFEGESTIQVTMVRSRKNR